MYRLTSAQTIVDNVVALSLPYLADKNNLDFSKLKTAYRNYLSAIQPQCPLMTSDQLFYADAETEKKFQNYFSESDIDMSEVYQKINVNEVMYPQSEKRLEILKKSFTRIEKEDSTFTDLFKLLMNTVFCTVSQNLGGTSVNPKYIGVMCAHHDMTAEEPVVPELFIHEFTHTALTLDEHRYGHYKNYELLKNPNTYLDATFREVNLKFPLNTILHSMIVGAEIIMARNTYIGNHSCLNQHVSTEKIMTRSRHYIKTIDGKPEILNILTERGKYLYELCRSFYNS